MTANTDTAKNPVVKTTALRAYPGWVVRQYRNGMYDGTNGSALTIGTTTFLNVVAEIRNPGASNAPVFRPAIPACPTCGGENGDHYTLCPNDPETQALDDYLVARHGWEAENEMWWEAQEIALEEAEYEAEMRGRF